MEFIEQIEIDSPITSVWSQLIDGFGEIERWDSSITESRLSGSSNLLGLKFSARTIVNDKGESKQVMTMFTPLQYSFSYRIKENLPFYVKKVSTTWSLTHSVDGNTLVVQNHTVQFESLGFLLAFFVVPSLKKQSRKQLQDLKGFMESQS